MCPEDVVSGRRCLNPGIIPPRTIFLNLLRDAAFASFGQNHRCPNNKPPRKQTDGPRTQPTPPSPRHNGLPRTRSHSEITRRLPPSPRWLRLSIQKMALRRQRQSKGLPSTPLLETQRRLATHQIFLLRRRPHSQRSHRLARPRHPPS